MIQLVLHNGTLARKCGHVNCL